MDVLSGHIVIYMQRQRRVGSTASGNVTMQHDVSTTSLS